MKAMLERFITRAALAGLSSPIILTAVFSFRGRIRHLCHGAEQQRPHFLRSCSVVRKNTVQEHNFCHTPAISDGPSGCPCS